MSMSTIRMRDIMALVVVAAILIAMIPTIVLTGLVGATDNSSNNSDNTEITFTVNGSATTISSVELYEADGTTSATAMDPLTEYVVKVKVNDANTLNDLVTVKAIVFWDADNYTANDELGSDNTNAHATMTFDNTTSSFSIGAGSPTTWELLGDCSAPAKTLSTGTFAFHFKPGKVARENVGTANWHIFAEATDGGTAATGTLQNLDMNWYGEITNVSNTATFSSVNIGCDNITSGDIRATYIANGNFSEQVKATTSWTGPGTLALNASGTPGNAEFSLMAADSNEATPPGDAVQVTGSYQSIDSTGAYTAEGGHDVTVNRLWLSLGDTGIPEGLYTGYVWYQILVHA